MLITAPMVRKHFTSRDIIRAIFINFVPVFLGILCGFGINRLYEKKRSRDFITTCMETIYKDNKQSYETLQFYSSRNIRIRDSINAHLHDSTISVFQLYLTLEYEHPRYTFQSGYDILENSEHLAKIDYTLLGKIKIMDRLYETLDKSYERWDLNDYNLHFMTDSTSKIKTIWQARDAFYRQIRIIGTLQTINQLILKHYDINHPDKKLIRNPDENYALGKPTYSSSYEIAYRNDSLYPHLATDGIINENSRWSSEFNDQQWFMVNLGAVRKIGRIILDWEVASAKSYKLLVSTDSLKWEAIYHTTDCPGQIEEILVSAEGKYIKLEGVERRFPYGYSLFEFEVYEE